MKFGLPNDTIENIKSVMSSFEGIEKVILFGSRALGTYKKASDIDLALYGTSLGLKEHNLIANMLDDLTLPYRIDVLLFDHIKNKQLIAHIEKAGQLFFANNYGERINE